MSAGYFSSPTHQFKMNASLLTKHYRDAVKQKAICSRFFNYQGKYSHRL